MYPIIQGKTEVVRSKKNKDGVVWRRRKLSTAHLVTTYEHITLEELIVVKKSKQKVYFDSMRLFASIYCAVKEGKNSDSGDAVDTTKKVVKNVMTQLLTKKIVKTTELSTLVTKVLKESYFDVALRYGSKYI
jgi:transcriptional regulator NrdR family protein